MWVYISSIFSSLVGYVFWIIASGFVGPSDIGSASAILAFQAGIIAITTLGIPTGLRRYIGICQKDEFKNIGTYIILALIICSVFAIPVSLVLLLFAYGSILVFGLVSNEMIFAIVLVLLSYWTPILISTFDSLLETEITALGQVLAAFCKIVIGFFLLISGLGFLAIMAAFVISAVILDLILIVGITKLGNSIGGGLGISKENIRELIHASLPAWIPAILTMLGQSLGVLLIYSSVSQSDTGLYYIAYAIASIIYTMPTSILGLMFPVLSGMQENREEFALDTLRLSMAITVPFGFLIVTYPFVPFIVIAPSFQDASGLLFILVVGALFYPIYAGYYGYVYAIGRYSQVLVLGAILNISRVVLYILLVTEYSGFGISVSYISGIFLAILFMIPLSRNVEFKIKWSVVLKPIMLLLPVFIISYLFLSWYVGIPILLSSSILLYTRFGVITKKDISNISKAFLSEGTYDRICASSRPLIRLLFGDN